MLITFVCSIYKNIYILKFILNKSLKMYKKLRKLIVTKDFRTVILYVIYFTSMAINYGN